MSSGQREAIDANPFQPDPIWQKHHQLQELLRQAYRSGVDKQILLTMLTRLNQDIAKLLGSGA